MTDLNIDIYADGADINQMKKVYSNGNVQGFTTNPSLMKKAGIKDYKVFSEEVVKEFPNVPISFEVFSDEFELMKKEARVLSSIGENVFVKIPVTNSQGKSSVPLIRELADEGIKLNVTAIFTTDQVEEVVDALKDNQDSIVSVFAGRIADTGVDPLPIMKESLKICNSKSGVKLLWASPREVFNIIQADSIGTDIITCTPELIKKMDIIGKDLDEYSKETVNMFLEDSRSLGFSIL